MHGRVEAVVEAQLAADQQLLEEATSPRAGRAPCASRQARATSPAKSSPQWSAGRDAGLPALPGLVPRLVEPGDVLANEDAEGLERGGPAPPDGSSPARHRVVDVEAAELAHEPTRRRLGGEAEVDCLGGPGVGGLGAVRRAWPRYSGQSFRSFGRSV